MGLIQVPGRRVKGWFSPNFPVEIDRKSALADGLISALHFDKCMQPPDLITGLVPALFSGGPVYTPTPTPAGKGYVSPGQAGGSYNGILKLPVPALNDWTVSALFVTPVACAHANRIVDDDLRIQSLPTSVTLNVASVNGAVYTISFTVSGTSEATSGYTDQSGPGYMNSPFPYYCFACMSFNSKTMTASARLVSFNNGAFSCYYSGSWACTSIVPLGSSDGGYLTIMGSGWFGGVQDSGVGIFDHFVHDRALTLQEMVDWCEAPMQVYRPRQRDIWLTVGGGGSTPQTAVVLGASIQLSLASAQVVANNALSGSNTESTSSGASVVPQFTTITTNGQNAATGNASVLASSNVQSNSTQVSEAAAPISSDTPIYGNAEQSEVSAASIVSAAINVTTASAQAIVSDGALNATVTISGQAIQQALMSAGISSSDIVYGDGTQSAGSSGSITTGVAATSPVYANGFEDSASSGSVSATLEMTGDAKQTEVSKVVITTTTMLTSFGLTKATVNSTISANTVFDANGNQIQASTGDVLGETPVDCHSIQISISRGVLTTVSTFNGAAIQSALSGANVTFALPSIPIFPNKKFGMSGAFSSRMPALPMSVVARNIVSSLTTRVLT